MILSDSKKNKFMLFEITCAVRYNQCVCQYAIEQRCVLKYVINEYTVYQILNLVPQYTYIHRFIYIYNNV